MVFAHHRTRIWIYGWACLASGALLLGVWGLLWALLGAAIVAHAPGRATGERPSHD